MYNLNFFYQITMTKITTRGWRFERRTAIERSANRMDNELAPIQKQRQAVRTKKCSCVQQMLSQANLTLRWDARLSMFLRMYPSICIQPIKITHNARIMMVRRCASARPLEPVPKIFYLYYRHGSNGQSNGKHEKTLDLFVRNDS